MTDTKTTRIYTAKGALQKDTSTAIGQLTCYNSASLVGADWQVVLGPVETSLYSNLAITLQNNQATKLESGSIEFSTTETGLFEPWDVSTFAGLSGSGASPYNVLSLQVTGNSRAWLRVRAIPSGSGGALTGSVLAYLTANTGG